MEFVTGLLDDSSYGCAPTLLWDFECHTTFFGLTIVTLVGAVGSSDFLESQVSI